MDETLNGQVQPTCRYARVLLSLNLIHPATRLGKLNEMGLEIWSPSQPNKYGGVDETINSSCALR